MSIWRGLIQEAQPYIIRGSVQLLRQTITDYLRPTAVAQPQLAEATESGCPYCAAYGHIFEAAGYAFRAAKADVPGEKQLCEMRIVSHMEEAYRALDVVEVIASEDGAALAMQCAKITGVRGDDYAAQGRELFAMADTCWNLAKGRNRAALEKMAQQRTPPTE